jgi:ribosomal protein S18 acetylase RimI-like enzyme
MQLRKMRLTDLDEVFSLQEFVYDSSYVEPRQTFRSHLESSSSLCIVLQTAASLIVGYAIAHPSDLDAIDPLSSVSVMCSKNPSVLYIHDICLHPNFRGYGHALAMLKFIANREQFNNLDRLALVSINSALRFWLSLGFRPRYSAFCESINSYGFGSMYLICSKNDLIKLASPFKQCSATSYE